MCYAKRSDRSSIMYLPAITMYIATPSSPESKWHILTHWKNVANHPSKPRKNVACLGKTLICVVLVAVESRNDFVSLLVHNHRSKGIHLGGRELCGVFERTTRLLRNVVHRLQELYELRNLFRFQRDAGAMVMQSSSTSATSSPSSLPKTLRTEAIASCILSTCLTVKVSPASSSISKV